MSLDLNGTAVEVAIALSFVFFLLSVIVSACSEGVAWLFKARAKNLVRGIKGLLGDEGVGNEILAHPLVQSDTTTPPEKRMPSYVSARNFSLALIQTIRKDAAVAGGAWEEVKAGVDSMPADSPLGAQLKGLIVEAETDLAGFRKSVERWFDDGMDRVSGWYRRWAQVVTCVIALAVAVGLNVDAIRITERLAEEPAVRQSVVVQAQAATEEPEPSQGAEATPRKAGEEAESAYGKLDALNLPILWGAGNQSVDPATVAGWLITALAISLGAPFWFDALGKVAHLKTTGKKPEEVK
jgi:hypothetical protein